MGTQVWRRELPWVLLYDCPPPHLPQVRKQAEGQEVLAPEDAQTVVVIIIIVITTTTTLIKVFAVNSGPC